MLWMLHVKHMMNVIADMGTGAIVIMNYSDAFALIYMKTRKWEDMHVFSIGIYGCKWHSLAIILEDNERAIFTNGWTVPYHWIGIKISTTSSSAPSSR